MKKHIVLALAVLLAAGAGCSGEDEPKSGGSNNGTTGTNNGTATSNNATNNATTASNGGTTSSNGSTNNGTAGTNNGTTGTNNSTNSTNNGTTGTNNGTGGTNNNTTSPVACGARAGDTCGDDEFCDFAEVAMCGATDQQGVCAPRPNGCPDNVDPVCGCDGQTYTNECEAQTAGTDALHAGACPTACQATSACARGQACVNGFCEDGTLGATCGGRNGVMCADGEYCHYTEAEMCGAFDAGGVCTAVPNACPQVLAPVCGCDQVSYGNECEAHAAGTSVFAQGECAQTCTTNAECGIGEACLNGVCEPNNPQGVCGGIVGLTCKADEWCDYPDTSMCGAADQQGICKTRPQACTAVYDPVCGCNNVTYSNSCVAHSAGVDVLSGGACN